MSFIDYIAVGKDKNGIIDFRVNGGIIDLSMEEMNELRQMLVVAIGTMEDMRRHNRMKQFMEKENEL